MAGEFVAIMNTMGSVTRRRLLCLSLAGLGLLVSAYLLARTFTLLVDRIPDTIDVCSAVFGASCDTTLLGPTSWMLGIPLAGPDLRRRLELDAGDRPVVADVARPLEGVHPRRRRRDLPGLRKPR